MIMKETATDIFVRTNQPKKSEIKKVKNIIKKLDLIGVFSEKEVIQHTNFSLLFGIERSKRLVKEHFVIKKLLKEI